MLWSEEKGGEKPCAGASGVKDGEKPCAGASGVFEISNSARVALENDLELLAYARHRAKASRSPAARHMFESYVERETRRMEEGKLPSTP
jgi:hypothetical protein